MIDNDISAPMHQSLNKPILMMGGERNLVLLLMVLAGVFIFSLHAIWAAVMGVIMWLLGHFALIRAARFDWQLSKTGARSLKYRRFYAAQATPFAPYREIK